MTRHAPLAAAVLALLAAAPALGADDVTVARAAFDRGAKLYRAGKFREAIGQFEAAYRAKPHGAVHFNVAQCRERLEEWPAALRSYHDYLREVPDAADRAAVRAAIGRLERRLAATGQQALLAYSDPPGAVVRIDGAVLGYTPVHTTLPPRRYRLTLALEGFQPEEREVVLTPEAAWVLDVVLRPAAPAPRPAAAAAAPPAPVPAPDLAPPPPAAGPLAARPPVPPPPSPAARGRLYTWIAAGVAVGAAGAGAWYGQEARKKEDALRDGTVHSDAASLARAARRNARNANLLYGLSGAAAAGGVALFFVEGRF